MEHLGRGWEPQIGDSLLGAVLACGLCHPISKWTWGILWAHNLHSAPGIMVTKAVASTLQRMQLCDFTPPSWTIQKHSYHRQCFIWALAPVAAEYTNLIQTSGASIQHCRNPNPQVLASLTLSRWKKSRTDSFIGCSSWVSMLQGASGGVEGESRWQKKMKKRKRCFCRTEITEGMVSPQSSDILSLPRIGCFPMQVWTHLIQ